MKKQFLFLILLLFTLKAIAGYERKKEVDSLLNKAKEFQNDAKISLQLESAMIALDLANEDNYDEGIAKGHFWAADALLNIGLYKEAFKHLEGIQATSYFKDEIEMQAETHRLKGKGYLILRLIQQALQEFQLQLSCAKLLGGDTQKKSYLSAFGNITTLYSRLAKPDSVFKYIQLQLGSLKGLDEKENVLLYIGVYDDLGDFYTKKGDFIKAALNLKKSLALIDKYNVPIYYNTYTYLANLEQEQGNYKKALTLFEESLANMEKVGVWDAVARRCKFLAYYCRYYNLRGKWTADEYDMAYNWGRDSLENKTKETMDAVMSQLVKSKDQESAIKVSKSVTVSLVALVLLVVAIMFFVWRSRHNRRVLGKKEEALQETETINKELTEQIGENKFNNLIELAKSNNPEFLTLFTELYPQFIQALKSHDANLRSTELEFCAMAFLNFSTKNISEYTYVTIRAVQVRKNRLRKKFEIPSDADFNNWMRDRMRKNPFVELEQSPVGTTPK